MAPKWLPGGSWGLLGGPPKKGPKKVPRGNRSWCLGGSPRAAFWSFFGLREVIFEGLFATGACSEKKVSKIIVFSSFFDVFGAVFLRRFVRLADSAAARAHLEKRRFRMESVAFFTGRPFARGTKRSNEG